MHTSRIRLSHAIIRNIVRCRDSVGGYNSWRAWYFCCVCLSSWTASNLMSIRCNGRYRETSTTLPQRSAYARTKP